MSTVGLNLLVRQAVPFIYYMPGATAGTETWWILPFLRLPATMHATTLVAEVTSIILLVFHFTLALVVTRGFVIVKGLQFKIGLCSLFRTGLC